jgi:hypothetical protein
VLIRLGRFAERLVPVAQSGCDRRSQVASTENWSAPSVVVDFRGELPARHKDCSPRARLPANGKTGLPSMASRCGEPPPPCQALTPPCSGQTAVRRVGGCV